MSTPEEGKGALTRPSDEKFSAAASEGQAPQDTKAATPSSPAQATAAPDDEGDGAVPAVPSATPESSPERALPAPSGPPPPAIDSGDHYAILQVSPQAEPEVIQAAYRQLARKYHPDRHPEATATEWMQKLNTAYAVLSDPQQRATYDALRRAESGQPPSDAAGQTAPIIYLSASEVDFGTVSTEQPVVSHVTVAVYAYSGEARVTPTRPWLSVRPAAFRGLMARIAITADPKNLPIGELQRGRVLLQAGETRATVDLEVRAVPPGIPELTVESTSLALDPVPRGHLAMGLLRMENAGGGLLEGTIASSPRWLRVEEPSFQGNEVRLDVTARTSQLRPGKPYIGELRISSNGGEASIEVQVTTRPRQPGENDSTVHDNRR